MKSKRQYEYEHLGTVELPDDINADVERRIEEAERELQETHPSV